ncbi:hypothetical protein BT63DRAFT_306452 [Microthyrium microscopicum]|uniref:BTB domain-containing protein n=1 Tax=Microthyrium microscopicum TaxID=703497 RepID=A0A6A6U7Q1_9PEZI|nr:hypothetical protein BT63DRAFT_306452 [Microthyrium microscopicum]
MASSTPASTKRKAGDTIEASPAAKKISTDIRAVEADGFLFDGEVVSILVGPHGKKFTLHVDPLCSSSDYFKHMLRSSATFLESAKHEVKLLEQSPRVFQLYAQYLYQGKIFSKPGPTVPSSNGEVPLMTETTLLLTAISLADYLQDDDFHNSVIDCLIARSLQTNAWPTTDDSITLSLSSGSSFLVDLIRDFCIYGAHEGWWTNGNVTGETHGEFWASVARGMAKLLKGGGRPSKWVPKNCDYHRHKDGKRCD